MTDNKTKYQSPRGLPTAAPSTRTESPPLAPTTTTHYAFSSLAFPIQMTLIMVTLNICSTITSSTVQTLYTYYDGQVTIFQLNLINFLPSFIYLAIAIFIHTDRIMRWKLVVLTFVCTVLGTSLQACYSGGYSYLVVASLLQGIPQPFILSNLLTIATQYFSAEHQGKMIGAFTSINDLFSGLVAVWCIETMYDLNGLTFYFSKTCMYISFATIVLTTLLMIYYITKSPFDEFTSSLVNEATPGQSEPVARLTTPYKYYSYLVVYGIFTSCLNVADNIIEQLLREYKLTDDEALTAMNLYMMPSVVTSIFIGWCHDKMKKKQYAPWILPAIVIAIQSLSQIKLFYGDRNADWLYLWIILFSASTGALTVVFLPTLLEFYTNIDNKEIRLQTESTINQQLMIWATFCVCASIFVFWWPDASVLSFGYFMIAASVIGIVALASTIKTMQ
jgi:hypothetical protein